MKPQILTLATAGLLAATAIGCTSNANELTLVTYSSFPAADTDLNDALAAFTEETGITVNILNAGDTGTMVTKAVLASGNPEGDVMWGVDNTLLSRATAADVFEPFVAGGASTFDDQLVELGNGIVTPVDFGDVCVNYDRAWFDNSELEPPATLDDLADPAYAGLLAVQHPGTSSPGLAFLLGTIVRIGDHWTTYWEDLVANEVLITNDWEEAYYGAFTRAGGDRPLVVSYGSSPPFEVLYGDDPTASIAPTGVIEDTCYRQVEFAGVLRGTDAPDEARQLVEFLVSKDFQQHIPLNLYVFPVADVALDQVFVDHAVIPNAPPSLTPADIDAGRASWVEQWISITG
jgi:thiamine transport system substrate-binding protein